MRAADAAASDWATNEHGAVRLVAAQSGVGDQARLTIGLQFKMKPGWKIYWRSPGDAGYPPSLEWVGSQNVATAILHWPAPMRFDVLGFTTLGYSGEVVLPVDVTLKQPGQATKLRAEVNYLTCDEICVPYKETLSLDLPVQPVQNTMFAALISKYRAHVPQIDAPGVTITRAEIVSRVRTLVVTATTPDRFANPDLFVDGTTQALFGQPKVILRDGGKTAQFILPIHTLPTVELAPGGDLTFTLVDGARAFETRKATVPGAEVPAVPRQIAEWISILAISLLGGLILNLMPCVLPVLSIKLLGMVRHGGAARRDVRRRFLATCAGIVVSFLVLAGILAALKAGGAAIGWGMQFQHPVFLVALVLVLTLFAGNMFGWFEIALPARLGGVAHGAGRARGGLVGDFLTGAFATAMATPCSAPFVGTAIGFALSGGALETVAVFAALGIGLAAPYLLVAAFPGLATRLPKPGSWMIKLKFVLGLALLGSAVWLLDVLAEQAGATDAWIVAALMAAVLAILALRSRLGMGVARTIAAFVLIVAAAIAAFVVPTPVPPGAYLSTQREAYWRAFELDAIPALIAGGRVVFVDVTADWCLTCKVNKRAVLSRDRVAKLLQEPKTVAMVADWTRPDERIARYLASFGRYGIPFNVVYGPGAPQGIALPELLTEAAVVAAMRRAAVAPVAPQVRK
ncbi:MAG: protein-disulfide reductase DsbD family protein [Alphaproteobacteria bacterium]